MNTVTKLQTILNKDLNSDLNNDLDQKETKESNLFIQKE
jgi:hypothetical protein